MTVSATKPGPSSRWSNSVNMSFIGIIPDESLRSGSREWKAWYAAHGERLAYDASTNSVILRN
jgi:hypothetical protein